MGMDHPLGNVMGKGVLVAITNNPKLLNSMELPMSKSAANLSGLPMVSLYHRKDWLARRNSVEATSAASGDLDPEIYILRGNDFDL